MTEEQKQRFMRLTGQSSPHLNISAVVEYNRQQQKEHAGESSIPEYIFPEYQDEFSDEDFLVFSRACNQWLDEQGDKNDRKQLQGNS